MLKQEVASRWWHMPGGPREVLSVAWPLMLSTGLFSLTIFIDRMLLYAYSDEAAAGAMEAGVIVWAVTTLPVGIFGFTSTFVAQYLGVARMDRAMRVVVQGLLMAIATGPLIGLVAFLSPVFFGLFHEADLVAMEIEYFQWIAVGAWATIMAAPLTGLFAGTNKTWVLLVCDAIVTALNAFLAYIMIFGYLGFPTMGIAGAGLASSISLVVKLLLLLLAGGMLRWPVKFENTDRSWTEKSIGLFSESWSVDNRLLLRLVRYGWPAGVSTLVESVSFSIIVLLVGRLGAKAAAATTLALGVNMIAFIPMLGLGMSVGVLVGRRLTQGKTDVAQRSVRSALWIAVVYSSFFAIMYGIFPDLVLSVYSGGTDPERYAEMRPIVIPILWFIALYCIFDAIQIVFVGALKGAGDVTYVLLGNIVSGVVVIGLGKWIGDQINGGLYWWWWIITVWVLAMAVLFAGRYLQGGWKTKRVIEPELL